MTRPYEQRLPWNLDWNLLRTFMVVVDQKGITRAAEFLGLTQPTLSSALKRLEDTVGKRLVDRRPSHFAVTDAGMILYRECNSMFATVSQISGLMNEAEGRVSGHITVVLTSHVVSPHFDAVLASFNTTHPDVTYSFLVAESSDVLNRVRQNRATLGVCLMREPDAALSDQVLFREFFGLYCGTHHPLFGKKDIVLSELRGEPSVSFQTDTEGGSLYSVTRLRELALLKPQLKGVSANLTEVRRMIVAGIGIGALPIHVARPDVERGNLWQLPPYAALPAVDVHVVVNPRRSMNPAEKIFVAQINALLETTPAKERTYS